jgi:hypothetical protein
MKVRKKWLFCQLNSGGLVSQQTMEDFTESTLEMRTKLKHNTTHTLPNAFSQ